MLQQFWNTGYAIISIIKSAKVETFNHSHDCGVSVCLYRRCCRSPLHPVKCLFLFTGSDLVSVHFSLIHLMSIMRIREILLISEIYFKLFLLYRHNILYYCLLDLENPKLPTWLKKKKKDYMAPAMRTILQVGTIDYFTESTFRPTPNVQYSSDDVLYCTGLFHWDELLYLQTTVSGEAI